METTSQASEGKRPYHSRTRQRQAEDTRQRILAATRALFASRGYADTTLDAIAERAEVSPKTVSAVFGSKRAILAEIINPNAFSAHVQQLFVELRATAEPAQRLALVAQITHRAYEPLVLELELLRTASVIAPELADLARQIGARRRRNQAQLVDYLHEKQVLRHSLPQEEAIDIVWALTSYDIYRMLVVEQHWEPARYETWLAELLAQHLLQSVDG